MKNKAEIEDELLELSPLLLQYKKQLPLPVVPDTYFSELATILFSEKIKSATY